jgi:hypothetical protein
MMRTITEWARRTSSSFGGSRPTLLESAFPATVATEPDLPGDLIYRLKHWPELPGNLRTAEVLRLVSLMSSRPLRRSWILDRTRMDERRLDLLVRRLSAQKALDVLDPSRLPDRPAY